MEILEAKSMSLNGKKQKIEKVELLSVWSCLDGNIKRKTKRKAASMQMLIPDEWAEDIIDAAFTGKKPKANYMLMRVT